VNLGIDSILVNRFYAIMTRIFKIVLSLITGIYCFLVAVVGLHWGLGVCPFYLATFKSLEAMPVVYGYPTAEGLIKALNRKIILGGCMVHSLPAVCQHCHFPARFNFSRRIQMESIPDKGENDE